MSERPSRAQHVQLKELRDSGIQGLRDLGIQGLRDLGIGEAIIALIPEFLNS